VLEDTYKLGLAKPFGCCGNENQKPTEPPTATFPTKLFEGLVIQYMEGLIKFDMLV
jgi:hypothetical protein